MGFLRVLLSLILALWVVMSPASAGTLSREDLSEFVQAPMTIGERDANLPVWPIIRRDATGSVVTGYVFESIDLAPLPGFAGKPINLLIFLDAEGVFSDVRLLSHHEPIFREGLGESALENFAAQYRGLSVRQSIRVVMDPSEARALAGGDVVGVQGVPRGTLSIRVLDKTILTASLKVARTKLGIAAGVDPDQMARLRTDRFESMDPGALRRADLLLMRTLDNRELERAFSGTRAAGIDPVATESPSERAIEWISALVDLPQVGRNLLDEGGWKQVSDIGAKGDHVLLIAKRGRLDFVSPADVPAGPPERLLVRQGKTVMELRHLVFDGPIALPSDFARDEARLYRLVSPAGLDLTKPFELVLRVPRVHGAVLKTRIDREFSQSFALPSAWVIEPERPMPAWFSAWSARVLDLSILVAGLGLLAVMLWRRRRLAASFRRMRQIRFAWLVFVLGFIGWWGQGQLSIVNLTALIEGLVQGRSLDFFLYDPMTVVLWVVLIPTFFLWGRATFCGWLCPFGALQEILSVLGRLARIRPKRLPVRLDRRLKGVKYVVLAVIVLCAVLQPAWVDSAVEIEPFKTAISLGFVRAWPYVLFAAVLLGASLLVWRGYCRYVCPLGAFMVILGFLRLKPWIERRRECGTPCQTCRHRCDYQAIQPSGAIDYRECFQCLDCVAIHQSDTHCAPRILERKRPGKVIHVRPVGGESA